MDVVGLYRAGYLESFDAYCRVSSTHVIRSLLTWLLHIHFRSTASKKYKPATLNSPNNGEFQTESPAHQQMLNNICSDGAASLPVNDYSCDDGIMSSPLQLS